MRSCASIESTDPQPVIIFAHSTVCTPILAPQSIADDAVAVMLAAQREQVERELDLAGIEGRGFQDLEADAVAAVLIDHPVVEPVDDQGAVIGRSQDKGELAPHALHRDLLMAWDLSEGLQTNRFGGAYCDLPTGAMAPA